MKCHIALTLLLGTVLALLPARGLRSASDSPTEILARGKYLAVLGDCVACHTNNPGKPFAGARPINTPFGVIYSRNITPDKETGIGAWSPDQFYRAMHEGIRADGAHLYPAFPYTYFTHISRSDSDAIHAYLKTVPPVREAIPPNQLPFPLNVRALMRVWNGLYFDQGDFRPDASKSAEWNRGAYIVTGAGHCGACHTPKNRLGADENSRALTGGAIDSWFAADLTQDARAGLADWTDLDIVEYLKYGRNARATASGSMEEVIVYSTSLMQDADLHAIAVYLKDQAPRGDTQKTSQPDAAAMLAGQAIFQDECSACHRAEGGGVPRFFPPLSGDSSLQSRDATTIIRLVLEGSRSSVTPGLPTPLAMPAFAWKLTDQHVADLVTYVRNSWGNRAAPVSTGDVRDLRTKIARTGPSATVRDAMIRDN
jgi:mono/diheme cytochrome c family protein